ncbi:MAG: PAS domain S-box protein, partial [Spirochaetota bacterium]
MTIGTPIKDKDGNLIAVLAGHVNLAEMSEIMMQRCGLSATEKTCLVNKFNFFVTDPGLEPGPALKKAVYTDGVKAGLEHQNGVGFYNDYRGVPVIGVYRWMPERELVILAEVDQAEAFAPIFALRKAQLGIGAAVAAIVALLGLFFARTITRPVLQLVKGAEKVGRGNLEYRIEMSAKDEVGQLATAFNKMGANLHRSQETLRESEAKYRNLTESLEELIYRADPETFVATYVNHAVAEIYGYTVEEFLGDPTLWENSIHPEDKEGVFAAFTEAQRKMESVAIEYRIIRKDKIVRWVTDHAIWEKDQQGNVVSLNGVVYDITERKRAEEQTKQLQEYLQLQFERIPIAYITWDIEFRVRSWNPAAERIFGFTAQEALGKHPYDLIVPKEAQPHVDDLWRRLLEGDTTAHSINDNITKDGRTIICQWSNTPLSKADGTVEGILSMVQDITERKQAEEKILRQCNLLGGINKVFREALTCETDEEVANSFLSVAEELTGSKFGLIGELNQAGRFDTIAITNPGWDACKMPDSEVTVLIKDMEIRGIDRSTIREEKSRIVNDLSSNPDRIGFPDGHPPVTSFLGVPLKQAGRTMGMIGLGNKESGYDRYDQE